MTSRIKLLVQHLVNHGAEMQQRPLRVVASPYGPAIEHLRRGAPLQQLAVLSDALAGPDNRRVEQASTALDLLLHELAPPRPTNCRTEKTSGRASEGIGAHGGEAECGARAASLVQSVVCGDWDG